YRSMPDAALLGAAASGTLKTADDLAREAKRMLADPKAHDAVVQFFSEWMSLDRLPLLTKDPSVTPDFATLQGYMQTETRTFVETMFFGSGAWNALLESPETSLNQPLAELYGVGGVMGLGFQPVSLDPKLRSGLL